MFPDLLGDNDSEPYRIKLIDFGHAIKIRTSNLIGRCGKVEYMAPENVNGSST